MTRAVAVTGMGAVTPVGVGAETLHSRWTSGVCGIVDGLAECHDFEPRDFMSGTELRRTDRFSQLAIAAGEEAMEQSGLARDRPYAQDRVACVLATGIGGISTLEKQLTVSQRMGDDFIAPLSIVMTMGNAAAMNLCLRFGLKGESFSVVSACSSGAQAIGAAMRLIRGGEADAVLVGGSEAATTPFSQAAFRMIGALSESGMSRPFDRRRDGLVLGEAAGALVLEAPDLARARGARVLGEVVGYGASSDAHHMTAPDDEGAAVAIRRALADAGAPPEAVDYVNAHGTSTPLNDRAETLALKSALGARAELVPISSTKSTLGHSLGAAGAVEAVATLLALRDGVAPPTLGLEEPDDDLDLDYVPGAARPLAHRDEQRGRLGISNSFAFGGHNAVIAMRVSPSTEPHA